MKIFGLRKTQWIITIALLIITSILYIATSYFSPLKLNFLQPIVGILLPLTFFSLLLTFFSKRIYFLWFFSSLVTLPYILYAIFSSNKDGGCWTFCYTKGILAIQLSVFLFGNLASISILIGCILLFINKNKLS